VLACIAGCGPKAPAPGVAEPGVPRLLPPPLLDPDVRGASYLTAVALQLQPGWQQFLEDCRLRLPARHALNRMTLTATAEVTIDARGQVVDVRVRSSGNADFDHAVRQVIGDASPLPKPPRELWSDDDRAHLKWLFARDRRQAGPATASVIDVELPLRQVVERLVGIGDLARAARRIARVPASARTATRTLMVAAIREALASADAAVRRAAMEAVSQAHIRELDDLVRELVIATNDVDLRLVALQSNVGSSEVLVERLRADLKSNPQLALAEARAIVEMGNEATVATIVRDALVAKHNPIAIQVLAIVPLDDMAPKLATWSRAADVRTRAAVCSALSAYRDETAWPLIVVGMRDRDASVRASCVEAARLHKRPVVLGASVKAARTRLRQLARDRDHTVRARAIAALMQLDHEPSLDASNDAAGEVRAAFAASLRYQRARSDAPALLERLIDDRDPDVRAAAWSSYLQLATDNTRKAKLAAHAATDSAAQVRRAALPAMNDDVLLQLSNRDDAPDVRTWALVEVANRRGRAAVEDILLERLAVAAPGSGERVRTALAWLVAH